MRGRSTNDTWKILNYEIQMYLGTRLLQGIPFPNHRLIRPDLYKALMESAITEVKALHLRILTDIFLDRRNSDDINIDDLIPRWREEYATLEHNLRNAYRSNLEIGHSPKWYLDKYLAHPDRKRGDHFDWSPIIRRMDSYLRDIFRTLPTDRLQALVLLPAE